MAPQKKAPRTKAAPAAAPKASTPAAEMNDLCKMWEPLPAKERALVALARTLGFALVAVIALILIFGETGNRISVIGSVAWSVAILGIFLGYFIRK